MWTLMTLTLILTGCAWLRPVDRRPIQPPVTWEELQEDGEDEVEEDPPDA